ncbi:DUF4247 domain-containing protein [Paenibacillus thailandensis]|uniref:DUF4247 domain-containing protein n=1 Tax=Paenibacillus thailandensis TaxID=393250 RepID=A0ABW5QWP5_9BACL
MNKWWLHGVKIIVVLSFIVPLLVACGVSSSVKEQYPLEAVNGSGSQTSYVYRAAGETVPEVAARLAAQRQPEQQSPASSERMFLVYPDEIVHVQQAPDNPDDTLIEIDSKEYVQQNYSMSFLEGYLLASLLDELFDYGKYGKGSYRGYSTQDVYKPQQTYRTPTEADKKTAPPVTVDRTGMIFKRSKTADSSAATGSSGGSGTGRSSSTIGKIITKDSPSSSSGDGGKSGSLFKKKSYSAPKVKAGRGKITRRR